MNSIPNPPILQWNINGFRSKHLRLLDLMQEISPAVVALQETKLATDVPMKIKKTLIRYIGEIGIVMVVEYV